MVVKNGHAFDASISWSASPHSKAVARLCHS